MAALDAVFGPQALAIRPRGGYHLWVSLPAHLDDVGLAAAALAQDVAVTPGAYYYATESSALHLRLSHVAAPSAADVGEGAAARAAAGCGDLSGGSPRLSRLFRSVSAGLRRGAGA